MSSLPAKFILTIKPREYLVQGPSHCGAYSVKGILWVNVLKHYGIDAEFKTARNLSPVEKINLLKSLITKNAPVIIRIGNGYFRSSTYNPVLGKVVSHWITLWGYDDKEKVFYVYDSGLTKNLYDRNVPIGNTKRTYDEVLRDWNFGAWQPWAWLTSPQTYAYIKTNSGKTI